MRRKRYTQIVNSLTVKSEIGSPMASLYILGNPDHYKSLIPVPFQWKGCIKEVLNAWNDKDIKLNIDKCKNKLIIQKENKSLIGISKVFDYMYRPSIHKHVCLYDWTQFSIKSRKIKLKKSKKSKHNYKYKHENTNDDVDDDNINYLLMKLMTPMKKIMIKWNIVSNPNILDTKAIR